jgi:hypothetical protein
MLEFLRKLFGIPLKGVLIRYSDKVYEGEVVRETATHFLIRLCNFPFEDDFWRSKTDPRIIEVFKY